MLDSKKPIRCQRGLTEMVIVLLIVMGISVRSELVFAQEKASSHYTLTIHYPDGKTKTLNQVISHRIISEEGAVFLSVILKDGRRFLISVNDREFEFSKELSQILEAQE
jgi:type IV secretory pathway ATPase VirB11/archaellum biosynthesis ATPase